MKLKEICVRARRGLVATAWFALMVLVVLVGIAGALTRMGANWSVEGW